MKPSSTILAYALDDYLNPDDYEVRKEGKIYKAYKKDKLIGEIYIKEKDDGFTIYIKRTIIPEEINVLIGKQGFQCGCGGRWDGIECKHCGFSIGDGPNWTD